MKKHDLMSCCGLDCADCPVFIATAKNDNTLRQKTAKEWSGLYAEYLGKGRLLPEDINCKGCWSKSRVFVGCLNCPIRKCCRENKLATCASCNEYKTCSMLKGFFSVPTHQHAKSNLEKIRATQWKKN